MTAIDHSQVRFIPNIPTNLPQTETERIAMMNTVAKMTDVICKLAAREYLTQKGVASV